MSSVTPTRVVLITFISASVALILFFFLLNNTEEKIQKSLEAISSEINEINSKLSEQDEKPRKISSSLSTGKIDDLKIYLENNAQQQIELLKQLEDKTAQCAKCTSGSSGASAAAVQGGKKEKRVISFGLYGSDPKYTHGAVRNTELQKMIFPDWICRFYVDDSVPQDIIAKLKENGAEIVKVDDIKGGIAGMFWRFLVADDPTVDRYIVRDSDSRLNLREKFAIDEWIESGKGVHILRDHPNHNYVMNGGMWGAVKGAIPNLKQLMDQWQDKQNYIADMNFLGQMVYPKIVDQVIAHDSYHCQSYPGSRSFPTRRFGWEHVGQVFDSRDIAREGDIPFISNKPGNTEACRRKPEWIYG